MSLLKLAIKLIADPTNTRESVKLKEQGIDPVHVSRPYDNLKRVYPAVVKEQNGRRKRN